MKTRNIPISKLEKLEESRIKIWEKLGENLSIEEVVEWCDITAIIYEVANHKYPKYNNED